MPAARRILGSCLSCVPRLPVRVGTISMLTKMSDSAAYVRVTSRGDAFRTNRSALAFSTPMTSPSPYNCTPFLGIVTSLSRSLSSSNCRSRDRHRFIRDTWFAGIASDRAQTAPSLVLLHSHCARSGSFFLDLRGHVAPIRADFHLDFQRHDQRIGLAASPRAPDSPAGRPRGGRGFQHHFVMHLQQQARAATPAWQLQVASRRAAWPVS